MPVTNDEKVWPICTAIGQLWHSYYSSSFPYWIFLHFNSTLAKWCRIFQSRIFKRLHETTTATPYCRALEC